jgi:hypothetical protein
MSEKTKGLLIATLFFGTGVAIGCYPSLKLWDRGAPFFTAIAMGGYGAWLVFFVALRFAHWLGLAAPVAPLT